MARNVDIPTGELSSFDLPPVCVVTGRRDGIVFKPVKFSWYPRWIVVFAPFALLIAAILAFALTRRVSGELPFNEEAWRKWRFGRTLFTASVLTALVLFISMPFAFAARLDAVGWVLVALAIGFPLTAWITSVRGRGPSVERITKTHITLSLPSAEASRVIAKHLVASAGAVGPLLAKSA